MTQAVRLKLDASGFDSVQRELDRADGLGVLGAERLVDLRPQLAGGVELLGDVRAADQLALDEDLRDRRPLAQRGQLLPDPRVGKDVDGRDRRARLPQRLQRAHRVAAGGRLGRALDEDDDRLGVDDVLDLILQRVLMRFPSFGCEARGWCRRRAARRARR